MVTTGASRQSGPRVSGIFQNKAFCGALRARAEPYRSAWGRDTAAV